MEDRDEAGPFFAGLIVGGFVGAVLGLFLAPRPGHDTLREIRDRGSELTARGREQIEEQTHSIRDALDEVREILRETVEEGREVLRDAMSEARNVSRREEQDLKSRFDTAREGRPPEGVQDPR